VEVCEGCDVGGCAMSAEGGGVREGERGEGGGGVGGGGVGGWQQAMLQLNGHKINIK